MFRCHTHYKYHFTALDNDAEERFIQSLISVQDCIVNSTESYVHEYVYPPTTVAQLTKTCNRKTEAFKCIKDKVKGPGFPGLAKRGLLTYVQGRQKYHKKYCADVQSEDSKAYLRDMSCLIKNKLARYREIDAVLLNSAHEVHRRNYTDPALELKHLCCALYTYKRDKLNAIQPECTPSREKIEEQINETVTDDLSIVCEEEEKLMSKVCPNLPDKLQVSKEFSRKRGENRMNSATLIIYLIATLGEPNAPIR